MMSPEGALTSDIRSRLAELFEGMEADAAPLAEQLVSSFFTRVPRYLDQLRAAVRDGDGSTVETAAHGLKGVAGNLGAIDIASLAADLELLGEERDLTSAGMLIARLESELVRLRAAIAASPVY